uniref:UDP-N-acetyl-alpha-D-muramoyl-L-alanyl-L-glutamate epimerase n=1 Tax=Candidatus Kentrum sp. LFY TaxID=2126342 RepID=A0A450U531_9GAMM|nr:MAG: hypothetical protein BECKLFY1418B_GA0070995_100213 [Candidatus Kentron sp. LFY]
MASTLWIAPYTRSENQLSISFGIDDLRFSTSYWYNDVSLIELEHRFGIEYMEKIYFHIIAFEANKLVSLKPDLFHLGVFEKYHTPEFEKLWLDIQRNVWGQWRYENNLPDYSGPRLSGRAAKRASNCVQVDENNREILLFCGGGKDSLVSLRILDRAGFPYSTCAYSNSIYGQSGHQHRLIGSLLDTANPKRQHKIWIHEDFLDSPVIELTKKRHQIVSITAAETPSSIFASLPIVLQHNYRYIGLGHERSADFPNLIWERTGEAINHQWGKSTEAEKLLNTYLRDHLISNCQYFSLLKPIYDIVIFNLLRQDLISVPFTHSCNTIKPWCKKCAKCAYVWLNYMAYLPIPLIDGMFRDNLFDILENQLWFRQLLGLEGHTPFECIGQIDESRLAFALCRSKGLTGKAMRMFVEEVKGFDIDSSINEYTTVDYDYPLIPPEIANGILPLMEAGAENSKEYLKDLLS